MLNRKIQPNFNTSERIDIKRAIPSNLSNGIPLYSINAGDQDVIRIDFIFDAGTIYSQNPLIAEAANSLIDKGSVDFSSVEIAEKFDFYGAYLELNIGKHNSQITLYTLNKYLEETLEVVSDIIFNAVFPEKESEIFLQNRYQRFLISRQKTEVLSHEYFFEALFGSKHPYGRELKKNDFDNISTQQIIDFYKNYYKINSLKIIAAGKVDEIHLKLLDKYFGIYKQTQTDNISFLDFSIKEKLNKYSSLEVKDSLQSSIRIGKVTINKLHKDYFNLNITSILLGGYFGSRLMTNIREDKGYTYGIYSSNFSLLKSGIFSISAESGKDVYKKAIEEIYKELKILRTVTVSEEELQRVKNWIIGSLAKIFDGPFALSDSFKSLLNFDLDYSYYEKYFETIQSITPEIVLKTAHKYLHEDTMTKVVVGSI